MCKAAVARAEAPRGGQRRELVAAQIHPGLDRAVQLLPGGEDLRPFRERALEVRRHGGSIAGQGCVAKRADSRTARRAPALAKPVAATIVSARTIIFDPGADPTSETHQITVAPVIAAIAKATTAAMSASSRSVPRSRLSLPPWWPQVCPGGDRADRTRHQHQEGAAVERVAAVSLRRGQVVRPGDDPGQNGGRERGEQTARTTLRRDGRQPPARRNERSGRTASAIPSRTSTLPIAAATTTPPNAATATARSSCGAAACQCSDVFWRPIPATTNSAHGRENEHEAGLRPRLRRHFVAHAGPSCAAAARARRGSRRA